MPKPQESDQASVVYTSIFTSQVGLYGTLQIGSTEAGIIDAADSFAAVSPDHDSFVISLVAGNLYEFSLDTAFGNPRRRLSSAVTLYNSSGDELIVDQELPEGSDLRVFTFTPLASGDYFLDLYGLGDSTGEYTLSAQLLAEAPPESSQELSYSIAVTPSVQQEGQAALSGYEVTVTRQGSDLPQEELTISLAAGTASASDFTAFPVLSLDAGQTSVTATLLAVDDAEVEGDETFQLQLLSASPAPLATSEIATISDDDEAPAADPGAGSSSIDDAEFLRQWSLNNSGQTYAYYTSSGEPVFGSKDADIDFLEAYGEYVLSSSAVPRVIAVIDSGIRLDHEDLSDNLWVDAELTEFSYTQSAFPRKAFTRNTTEGMHGYDFVNNDGTPEDELGHGTHVSGTAAAVDNATGVIGVDPHADIMVLKAAGSDGRLLGSHVIAALDYAIRNGADIINASYSGSSYTSEIFSAYEAVWQAGIIIAAAAGNNGSNNDVTSSYPANLPFDNIISVAASTDRDALASFSNYGVNEVDLAAPGVNIYSTVADGTTSYDFMSGTSMAAPHVAGAASLLWSLEPTLSYRQVIDRIIGSVDEMGTLEGLVASGGRLNIQRALAGDLNDGTGLTAATTTTEEGADQIVSNIDDYADNNIFTATLNPGIARMPELLLSLVDRKVGIFGTIENITMFESLSGIISFETSSSPDIHAKLDLAEQFLSTGFFTAVNADLAYSLF